MTKKEANSTGKTKKYPKSCMPPGEKQKSTPNQTVSAHCVGKLTLYPSSRLVIAPL